MPKKKLGAQELYEICVDLFCGAGGTSTGFLQAVRELGLDVVLYAINHNKLAIGTHELNHPNVKHIDSDLEKVDPCQVVPSGFVRLLLASPECTHFSNAAGGRPVNPQSRATIKYVLRWVTKLDVQDVLIENVPEFKTWGPIHRTCQCRKGVKVEPKKHDKKCHFMKPIKNRKGEYFYRFIRKMESLGYKVDHRVLTSADYGDPTTRKRLFIMARKNKNIAWAEPTHHKEGGDIFGALPRWKTVREHVIDWNLRGTSIYKRKKALVPNTMKKIVSGLFKHSFKPFVIGQQSGSTPRSIEEPLPTVAGQGAISLIEPYIVEYHNGEGHQKRTRSVDEPLPTLDTSNRFGLAQPFLIQMDQGGKTHSIDKPMNTITSADAFALAEPFILPFEGINRGNIPYSVDEPMKTITSRGGGYLVQPYLIEYYGTGKFYSVDQPLKTQTGKDRFGLVEPIIIERAGKKYLVDILFRMLHPRELANAMSFPKDYKFLGNREEVVKQIGNAVSICLAMNLTKTLMAS